MNPFLVTAPLFITQYIFLYLTGRGFGQVAERDGGGALEMSQAFTAEGDELRFCGLLTWFKRHKGFGPFAPLLVGDGDDGAFHDGGMLSHGLLNFDS